MVIQVGNHYSMENWQILLVSGNWLSQCNTKL